MGKIKQIEITVKDQLFYIKTEELNNRIWFHLSGRIFILDQKKLSSSDQAKKDPDKNLVLSPMPGQIVKVLVQFGSEVEENQTLLILSSMKMEYTLKASKKGFIKSVKVKEGEKVSADQELVEITKSVEKI